MGADLAGHPHSKAHKRSRPETAGFAGAAADPGPAQHRGSAKSPGLCAGRRAAGAHLRALPPGRKRDLFLSRGH